MTTKRLVIAEKPSVAHDLAKAMGPYDSVKDGEWFETADLVITFAVGHLLELVAPEKYNPKWKNWSLKELPMLPETFQYAPRDKRAATRLKVIRKLAERDDVTGLVNACDAGREGEHIFRTILHAIEASKPVERLWLSSMTTDAIRRGFGALKPSQDYDPLGDAAASRSEADWLIGMNSTRALTRRLKSFAYDGAWSAGRVQTPTLAMCVSREMEILKHEPQTYWEVKGSFKADSHSYEGVYRRQDVKKTDNPTRIYDRAMLDKLMAALASGSQALASETRTRRQERPPLPFDLTSLQRATGMTAKRTQDVAQVLYERYKVLSYPRTDSRHLPKDQLAGLNDVLRMVGQLNTLKPAVETIQSDGAQNTDRVFDDKKVTDHHAIVPVGVPKPGELDDTAMRVYLLVVRQFLASLMKPAQWEQVVRDTVVQVEGSPSFRSTGRMLVVPGWQQAMGKTVGHGSSLAELKPATDAPVTKLEVEAVEQQTKPPGRLTDASLLRKMETCGKEIDDQELSGVMKERGLGTPATRADTIERLIRRGYLAREGRSLRATAKAIRLVDVLERVGALSLTSAELTGEMEYKLAQVESGVLSRQDYMAELSKNTSLLTDILVQFDFDTLYGPEQVIGTVPKEKSAVVWETAWGYSAEGGETFFIWKDVQGHVIVRDEMRRMLEADDGRIGPVFLYPGTRSGGGYEANLRLRRRSDEEYDKLVAKKPKRPPSRWLVEVEPLGGRAAKDDGTEETVEREFLTLPDGLTIIETNLRWADKEHLDGERPKAVLPKRVCDRELSEDEAKQFFEERRTDMLGGFISRRGKPFKARLILKKNGRHGFEFEPRKPRAPKGAKAASKGKKADVQDSA